MVHLELEADVPESRQITVTLPPEVPTGRARLSINVGSESEFPKHLPRLQAIIANPPAKVVYSGQLRIDRDEKSI